MGLFNIFKKKKKTAESIENSQSLTLNAISTPDSALAVVMEEITAVQIRETQLVEITDKNVLSRIDAIVPSIGSSLAAATNIAENVAAKAEPLYRVILKNGGELVDSRTMKGAKRAMTIGSDGIRENANLVQVAPNGLSKANNVAAIGANAMNVASMVVGQYYMQQVDEKIKQLQAGVEAIADFLEIQYKSQVVALLELVFSITKFQIASLENEELRNRELDKIQQLQMKCLELLNQAEMHSQKCISKENCDYSVYIKITKEVEKWIRFQQILLQLLNQISTLDFALHIGAKTKEQCFDNMLGHLEKANKNRRALIAWHEKQCKVLKIDLVDKRRKNTGFLALLEKPISVINDNWNYHTVDDAAITLIKGQAQAMEDVSLIEGNPFNKDVEIVCIGNKKYYLPNSSMVKSCDTVAGIQENI